jgi:hypothetical protein
LYPWRKIHENDFCKSFHQMNVPYASAGADYPIFQTMLNGSFARFSTFYHANEKICSGCTTILNDGTFFIISYCDEVFGVKQEKLWINLRPIQELVKRVLESCQLFYSKSKDAPNQLLLSVGIKNSMWVWMHNSYTGHKSCAEFVDPEFRIDFPLNANDILTQNMQIDELYYNILFAYNVHNSG